MSGKNILVERLLAHSPFRWDSRTYPTMVAFFDNQSAEHQAEFIAASKRMKNDDFEATVYWGIISGHVVACDQMCKRCAVRYGLVVHHATYVHRGEEHRYLDDLETLCWGCHQAQHVDAAAKTVAKERRISLAAARAEILAEATARRNSANRRMRHMEGIPTRGSRGLLSVTDCISGFPQ